MQSYFQYFKFNFILFYSHFIHLEIFTVKSFLQNEIENIRTVFNKMYFLKKIVLLIKVKDVKKLSIIIKQDLY